MSETDGALSFLIYQYLCNIIGTEEVVKTRRNIFFALDSVVKHSLFTVISSGSKGEGLDLRGSDYDQMYVVENFMVFENSHLVSSFTNKILMIIDISNTKPGFTKLKLYDIQLEDMHHTHPLLEIVEGEAYVSSKYFREYDMSDDMIIHGPCQSFPDNSYDCVRCFRCKEWITPAQQWIFRSRSSWPDHRLVMSIVKCGVLFVPIGCRGSVNEDLEWRISFSVAEKQLIGSFSHTQLLCYALLKIILKDIIKKIHDDLICSYFLKTILFWLFEESSPSEWHPGNMISCFKNCLRRLIYCVQYKTCLHYFIPENNFFKGRFNEYQHKCLIDTLNEIYNSLWTYVFHTDTFQRFNEEQRISLLPYLTASSLSCLSYTTLVSQSLSSRNKAQIITCIINMNDKELSIFITSQISKYWMQSPEGSNVIGQNKSAYQQYQIRLHCFKAGLYNDCVSAWSLLASLVYKCRRFNECINILNYTLSKCNPDRIHLSRQNSLYEQTYFQKSKQAFGLLLTCKHLINSNLSFCKPYILLPVELTSLIKLSKYNSEICIIPPVVYLNMLSFLCCHHLGDTRGKLNALRDLELTIRDKYFIIPNEKSLQDADNCLKIAKSMM